MRVYANLGHGEKVYQEEFKPAISFRVKVDAGRQEEALRQSRHVLAMTLRKPIPQGDEPGIAKVIYGGFDSREELIAGLKNDLKDFPEDYVKSLTDKLEHQWT